MKELKSRLAQLVVLERTMAQRANAKTVEVTASHVACMSRPVETARLIKESVTSTHIN